MYVCIMCVIVKCGGIAGGGGTIKQFQFILLFNVVLVFPIGITINISHLAEISVTYI